MENKKNELMLIILDGWELGKEYPSNIIKLADTPAFDKPTSGHPNSQLIVSGNEMGPPAG